MYAGAVAFALLLHIWAAPQTQARASVSHSTCSERRRAKKRPSTRTALASVALRRRSPPSASTARTRSFPSHSAAAFPTTNGKALLGLLARLHTKHRSSTTKMRRAPSAARCAQQARYSSVRPQYLNCHHHFPFLIRWFHSRVSSFIHFCRIILELKTSCGTTGSRTEPQTMPAAAHFSAIVAGKNSTQQTQPVR